MNSIEKKEDEKNTEMPEESSPTLLAVGLGYFLFTLDSQIEPIGGPKLSKQVAEIVHVFHSHLLLLILTAGVMTEKHVMLVVPFHVSLDGGMCGSKSR